MESFFLSLPASYDLINLFVLSFLAASLLPIGSDWYLVYLITQEISSPTVLVLIASVGNYLGAATNYYIGYTGSDYLKKKKLSGKSFKKAENIWAKYGSYSLLFSWLPIVGDPLCLVAGLLKTSFTKFSILVFVGKLTRYIIVAIVTLQMI
ncbi:MAG: VTT domain-containing protein [Desulfotalea sp.]